MVLRPAYMWLPGVFLFAPSAYFWTRLVPLLTFDTVLDTDTIRYLHLPMLAMLIGITIPLAGLRLCWNARWRTTAISVICYGLGMLAWGVADIRHLNYQIGGHDQKPQTHTLSHMEYFHAYLTWYFLPYKLIEPG